jgi:hypothetical protein
VKAAPASAGAAFRLSGAPDTMRPVVSEALASETPGVAVAPAASATAPAVARPYPRSWLNLLFEAVTRLPGPTWLAYVVLAIPSIVVSNAALWLSGLRPWGELDPAQVFWGLAGAFIVAATYYLRNVAGDAFDAFRPALGGSVADADQERYRLTTIPARGVLLITLVSFGIGPLYYAADPVGSQVVGLSPAGLAARLVSEGLSTVFVLAIIYQALRQLRQVGRLHKVAERVDPFSPLPLYAFSRLTAQTAGVLILFNAAGFVLNPALLASDGGTVLTVGWLAGISLVAGFIFIAPLRGMHGRLTGEKERLEAAAGERLRALLAELNAAIDARASAQVDALDRTISALRHEREILAKLPTWPWSGATIRGFASALFLPIALFLIQRFLSQFLS